MTHMFTQTIQLLASDRNTKVKKDQIIPEALYRLSPADSGE